MIKIPNHEGYIAFCDKKPLVDSNNPYSMVTDPEAHFDWVDGWRDAEKDFKRLQRWNAFKANVLNYVYVLALIVTIYFTAHGLGLL